MHLKFNFSEETPYLTHGLHIYPAKFPPQLPKTILKEYAHPEETVLDPFVGSGTTLVEAVVAGINAIGVDINPLACLISKVKTTPIEPSRLKLLDTLINNISAEFFEWQMGKDKNFSDSLIPKIPNIKHWFQQNVVQELSLIKKHILALPDQDIKDLSFVALSAIIVRVSNQESDTRFAAVKKNINDGDTIQYFTEKISEFKKIMVSFWEKITKKETEVKIFIGDARYLTKYISNSVDIIITSPPYANTYDYYLYHKFRMYWLDMNVSSVQYSEIGSRREYSSLKKGKNKWKQDLTMSFTEMLNVLKKGKFAFIVIGDSVIQRELIRADLIISEIAEQVGFKIIDVISSNLEEHSKVFNPFFSQKGKREHLIMLQKQ